MESAEQGGGAAALEDRAVAVDVVSGDVTDAVLEQLT
jgi:hypothetical protein